MSYSRFGLSMLLVTAFAVTSVFGEVVSREACVEIESELFLTHGDVVVTQADVDAFLMDRVPEGDRADVLASPERIGRILDNILRTYSLSSLGHSSGALADRQLQSLLYYLIQSEVASFYQEQFLRERELDSYEEAARELYLTRPQEFTKPPTIDFYHILIPDQSGSSEVELMRLALDVHDRLESGQTFGDVRDKFLEQLGPVGADEYLLKDVDPHDLVPQLASALQETHPNELTPPVRSRFGWHVAKLIQVNPSEQMSWEEARPIAESRARTNHRALASERLFRSLQQHDSVEFAEGAVARLLNRYGLDGQIEVPSNESIGVLIGTD